MPASNRVWGRLAGTCLALATVAVCGAGCEFGGPRPPHVIPGPAVPSPLPGPLEYVWEGQNGLEIWKNNPVSQGPLALVGSGPAAFLRVEPVSARWILRGPDLEPSARDVRTLRLRYRWIPDPQLPPTAARTGLLRAFFDRAPSVEQLISILEVTPSSDWRDADFETFREPIATVRYVYLQPFGWNAGTFDIGRIELRR